MAQLVKIKSITHLTHDVIEIVADKPSKIAYEPGQAVDISIPKTGWENERRPFTFTSLPEEESIQFTIKTYPEHHGVTEQLLTLNAGEELMIYDPFGDIAYKGEGLFIAGGAGVTPFIAIFKQLEKENKIGNNKLIFANKTKADIIQNDKFIALLGDNFINVLSEEEINGYEHGRINEGLLKKHITTTDEYFYICGPEPMMNAVEEQLTAIGVASSQIVKEGF